MMRFFTLLAIVGLLFLPRSAALAQDFPFQEGPAGEITDTPVCGDLINQSDQAILGSISTMPADRPDGIAGRFQDNFRLEAGEKTRICSTGPFYEGRRLELVIRTLLPLFQCHTQIDRDVILEAQDGDNGFRKLSANCY